MGFIALLALFGRLASAPFGIVGKRGFGATAVGCLAIPLLIISSIALTGVDGASVAGEAGRGVSLPVRSSHERGGWELRRLTVEVVSNQDGLFNKINSNGNSLMSNGDEVVVSEGDYVCDPCASSTLMFNIDALYGQIRCEGDDLECKLDGEGSRQVMVVFSTGEGILNLRGLHIFRGNAIYGGGLYINNGAIVTLELMIFQHCQATGDWDGDGGGAIYAYRGTLNLYGVSFLSNTATNNKGDDVYVYAASLTIHTTCPDGYGGHPTEGKYVDHVHVLLATFPQLTPTNSHLHHPLRIRP